MKKGIFETLKARNVVLLNQGHDPSQEETHTSLVTLDAPIVQVVPESAITFQRSWKPHSHVGS